MSTSPPIIILPSGETAAIGVPRRSASDALLTTALCATLCFAILAFGGVEEWAVLILEIASAAIFVAWAAQQVLKGDFDLSSNPVYWPMLGFAAVVVTQIMLRLSAYAYQTEIQAMRFVSYAMLLFVASQVLRTAEEQRRFLGFMGIFGIGLAAFMLMQFFGGEREGLLDTCTAIRRGALRPLCESQPLRWRDRDVGSYALADEP
jgi:hypothetical protein